MRATVVRADHRQIQSTPSHTNSETLWRGYGKCYVCGVGLEPIELSECCHLRPLHRPMRAVSLE